MPASFQFAQGLHALTEKLPEAEKKRLQQGRVVVTGQQGTYTGRMLVSAHPKATWDVLTDYNNFDQFLPSVVSSRVIEQDGHRSIVEQISARQLLVGTIESRVMTENVETPYQSVTFRMIEGDLKMLRGCWQLHVLDEPAHTLLITQVITAHAELGPFKKLFYKVFKASVEETMQALRQEVSRRQEISS